MRAALGEISLTSSPQPGCWDHGGGAGQLHLLRLAGPRHRRVTLNLACNGTSSPRTTGMDCDHLKTHMPRYFFNLTNDIRTVVDADGVQLEDEEAMRLEAVEMVTDLREEAHITGMDWSGWRVIVRDENGCECLEVKF
jgi:hypothetical protein